jgi:arylsulfatase A
VLLIVSDDQGYGDLSLHGNPHLRTPNLDRLGQSGVRFDRFFVSSVCAPTRAALLTGRWPLRTGCHGVSGNRETVRSEEVTLAEALAGAGYRTACIGKWHNGEHVPFTPQGQGFETFYGFLGGHWNSYFDPVLLRGDTLEPAAGYITDVLTDEAMRFIARSDARPFFCYLAYNAPHSPFQVPDRYFDRFKAAGFDDTVSAFWGMVENLDDNVGRLLDRLDALGLARDTIVLFLTDNGGTAGVKLYNAGMRGGKTSVHEGGTRVPLFVRWPAAGWATRVAAPLAAHVDLYPTLLDLCGVPPPEGPPVDGVSLRPLLEGREADWPERTLFVHNGIDETNQWPAAVRTPRYRLVREIQGPAAGSSAVNADATVKPWQLYDMLSDPGEKTNLASRETALVKDLAARYDAWYADLTRGGVRRPPIPVGLAGHDTVTLPAHHAVITPPLHFAAGSGFSHDWLTGWTSAAGRVTFEVDVAQPGRFAAELAFACAPADAGSRIRLSAGTASCEAAVTAAPPRELPLPHRDAAGHAKYRNREWAALAVGALTLPAGRTTLALEALSLPGAAAMDFKHLRLTRTPDASPARTEAGPPARAFSATSHLARE